MVGLSPSGHSLADHSGSKEALYKKYLTLVNHAEAQIQNSGVTLELQERSDVKRLDRKSERRECSANVYI